jgi:hypothetical protein
MVRFGDIRRQSHHKPQEAVPAKPQEAFIVGSIGNLWLPSFSSNTALVALLVESSGTKTTSESKTDFTATDSSSLPPFTAPPNP